MNRGAYKTLLLVEDEAITAATQKKSLESYGYKVRVAYSGEKALELFETDHDINLILMDIDLGKGLDGPETAKILLKYHNIPIVFLSSHTEPALVEKTEKITSYGYVVKNSGITVLDASIKMAFKLFNANKQIAVSEGKQKAMLSNSSGVTTIISTGNIIKYQSSNAEKWFGWQLKDLIGTDGWALVHPDDIERVQYEFQTFILNTELRKTVEFRYKCKDGTYKPVEMTGTNMINDPVIDGILLNYHDITERKLMECALLDANQFNEEIINCAKEGIIVYDAELRFRVWNPYMENITGMPGSQVLGRHPWELFSFMQESGVVDLLKKALAGEVIADHIDFRYNVKQTGKNGWVRDVCSSLRDSKGEIIGVIEMISDITDRKKDENDIKEKNEELEVLNEELNAAIEDIRAANEKLERTNEELIETQKELIEYAGALKESEKKYRDIYNNAVEGIFQTTKDGKLTGVNPSYAATFGYKSPESMIKEVSNIGQQLYANPADREYLVKLLKEQNRIADFEVEARTRKGEMIWVSLNVTAVKDETGSVRSYSGTMTDISERKRAGEQLRERERYLNSILETTQDGFFVLDFDGHIADANDSYCRMSGYTRSEILQLKISGLIADEDPLESEACKNRILKNGSEIFQTSHRRKDGSIFDVEVSISWLNIKKGLFICFCRDITGRKQLEEQYSMLIHNTSDVIWTTDLGFKVTYVSPAIERLLGETVEVHMKRTIDDRHFPEDAAILKSILIEEFEKEPYADKNRSRIIVTRLNRQDGSYVWVEYNIKFTRDSSGKMKGLQGITRDITERKLAEERLQTRMKYEMALSLCSREFINLSEPEKSIEKNLKNLLVVSDVSRVYIFENYNDHVHGLCMKQIHEVHSSGENPENDRHVLQHMPYANGFSRWEKSLSGGIPVMGVIEDFPSGEREILQSGGIITLLVIPVFVNGEWFGFIGFDDTSERYNWDSNDVYILTTAAEMLGIYIERIRKEKNIIALLNEKEFILREVHHRIKNNMNIIKNLLFLQSDTSNEPSVSSALEDAGSRVLSMMLLYDKLYQSADFKEISANDYIPSLVDEIICNFSNCSSVNIVKNIDDFVISSDKLQPLGIIINELITNIMKHAFKGTSGGLIIVSAILTANIVSLVIQDNGVGIPESISFENSTGFGMQLVGILTEQIGGSIRIERGIGTRFILDFSL